MERRIEHPLRTIVLQFDETKPETDYEINLLQAYIRMHDRAYTMVQKTGKLQYEYGELEDEVKVAEKVFAPIALALKEFKQEAEVLSAARKNEPGMRDVLERMEAFYENIDEFHQKVLNPLSAASDALNKDYNDLLDYEEKFDEDYEKFNDEETDELYQNYDAHSLDLASFDQDLDDMKAVFKKMDAFLDARDKVIDHYNQLMQRIKTAYEEWDETKRLASRFYDEGNLLDSSLSDSFIDSKGHHSEMPLYLIQPGDKRLQDFKDNMGLMGSSDRHSMTIAIPVEVVEQGELAMLQDLIMALQHFPKMMEKMLFAIRFEFLNEFEVPMTDDEWKGQELPALWINKFRSIPCILFFLEDEDTRSYFLMGDLLFNGSVKPEGDGVYLEGEVLNEVCRRLFESCWFFLLFCHNTGFDPQPYIESVLAASDLPVTSEQVWEKYQEDIKQGIQLRAVSNDNGKSESD